MRVGPNEIQFDPLLPLPVVLLLLGVLLGLTALAYARVGAATRTRIAVLLGFRALGIVSLAVVLLQPSRVERIPPPPQDKVTLIGVDTSLSMKQVDVDRMARLDAAKKLLVDAAVVSPGGELRAPRTKLCQFGEDLAWVQDSLLKLAPAGRTTRFHRSVTAMLNALTAGDRARALILLTDGHDLELFNPLATGAAARNRQVPIYAVPLGKQGKVRDISARITSYQPYCYVKQKARIGASLRLIGCELEDLRVQLLRHNQVVQTQQLNAEENQELPVSFEVSENQTGQYEYEIRVLPAPGEIDLSNNSAITYLNVIDQQIEVLVLEGSPYWDTTFLRRSLMRNDKFNVDSLVRYADNKVHPQRKTGDPAGLKPPATAADFRHYDLVVLGRDVDRLLQPGQLELLARYVKEDGGTVVFSRGRAFRPHETASDLEPVDWGSARPGRVRLQPGRDGQAASLFRNLVEGGGGADGLPEMLAGPTAGERKPLTATLANVAAADGEAVPGMVHRRYGQGQVLSVGVEGLWRWCLNAKVNGPNTAFDRFWDQAILWLLASRDFVPQKQFSLRTSSANVPLGEKVHFRLLLREPDPRLQPLTLRVFYGDRPAGQVTLAASTEGDTRRVGEYLPEKTGKYRVEATFPDGTRQESRFIVFTENLEETEVAADVGFLKRLCESSGGRVIDPPDLPKLLTEFAQETLDATPKTQLEPLWDRPWVLYAIALLFGLDWWLRRRWGLT